MVLALPWVTIGSRDSHVHFLTFFFFKLRKDIHLGKLPLKIRDQERNFLDVSRIALGIKRKVKDEPWAGRGKLRHREMGAP